MRFIDIEQGSPEWHELRKTKIGASMAPIIMGTKSLLYSIRTLGTNGRIS